MRLPLLALLAASLTACAADPRNLPPAPDLAGPAPQVDMAVDPGPPNECGGWDPTCEGESFGPPARPFPLPSDPQIDPGASSSGVDRDPNGWLLLGQTRATFDFLWIASTEDWGTGTISKLNSQTVREVARYFTVTCFSNPGDGSRAACDGTKGCCSRDDYDRFQRRAVGQPAGDHQKVQLSANLPSRTAVDYNGDVWVANRAFAGQSSVTKIANELASCVDRNGVAGIQTSSDQNGDGVIDTDCNRNGVPDDGADVQAAPCANGKPQEFWGFDDDCVLLTTNTGPPDQFGRPLALGSSGMAFAASDAWAGTYKDGRFYRVDGVTGQIKSQTQVAGSPYGATVDMSGVVWVATIGDGRLHYFQSANPGNVGTTRTASFPLNAYGVTMDRDQNVWQGGWTTTHAFRYAPDRSGGFATLGSGFWTQITSPGQANGATGNARGIAADSRTPAKFFVWVARDGGWLSRIDVPPLPMGQDTIVDGSSMPAVRLAGTNTIGAGVDIEQNIWGVSYTGSVATRVKVDNAGAMTAPDLSGADGAGCPAGNGDRCPLNFAGVASDARPYTYSDFTGFGLRNFTNPRGTFAYVLRGCDVGETRWSKAVWDFEQPPNTQLSARVRTGKVPQPDASWGAWSPPLPNSPALLDAVMPNPAPYLQIEFTLSSTDKTSTPRLKSFTVYRQCENTTG